jgi:hypothetical protein
VVVPSVLPVSIRVSPHSSRVSSVLLDNRIPLLVNPFVSIVHPVLLLPGTVLSPALLVQPVPLSQLTDKQNVTNVRLDPRYHKQDRQYARYVIRGNSRMKQDCKYATLARLVRLNPYRVNLIALLVSLVLIRIVRINLYVCPVPSVVLLPKILP